MNSLIKDFMDLTKAVVELGAELDSSRQRVKTLEMGLELLSRQAQKAEERASDRDNTATAFMLKAKEADVYSSILEEIIRKAVEEIESGDHNEAYNRLVRMLP